MNIVSVEDIRYADVDVHISDIFPEGWTHRKGFSLYSDHDRPCSALFFILSNIEVSFVSDVSAPYNVSARKGDIVFIPRGARYHVDIACDTDLRTDTYTINFDILDNDRNPILLSDRISVIASRQDNIAPLRLKNLFDIFYRNQNGNITGSRNLSKTKGEFFLLLDMISESASQKEDHYYPIRKGIDAFLRDWAQNEKIEKYAEMCGVSVTYFYRCFKKWSGNSPIEYRNALRLSNAESLIRCTDMQIQDISTAVGFDDPFYFCRIFSQKFGEAPQKYRKRLRQKA